MCYKQPKKQRYNSICVFTHLLPLLLGRSIRINHSYNVTPSESYMHKAEKQFHPDQIILVSECFTAYINIIEKISGITKCKK